jgi:hypothetical protein
MYKDRVRQREYMKLKMRARRGVIPKPVIPDSVIPVIPKEVYERPPTVEHHPACKCMRCS